MGNNDDIISILLRVPRRTADLVEARARQALRSRNSELVKIVQEAVHVGGIDRGSSMDVSGRDGGADRPVDERVGARAGTGGKGSSKVGAAEADIGSIVGDDTGRSAETAPVVVSGAKPVGVMEDLFGAVAVPGGGHNLTGRPIYRPNGKT